MSHHRWVSWPLLTSNLCCLSVVCLNEVYIMCMYVYVFVCVYTSVFAINQFGNVCEIGSSDEFMWCTEENLHIKEKGINKALHQHYTCVVLGCSRHCSQPYRHGMDSQNYRDLSSAATTPSLLQCCALRIPPLTEGALRWKWNTSSWKCAKLIPLPAVPCFRSLEECFFSWVHGFYISEAP